jgi:hypothetical protein
MYPVETQEAENFALENGVNYFETSSLLGDNINEVFNVLIQNYYTKTEYYNLNKNVSGVSENIEEEDSDVLPMVPQINSGIKLPFDVEMNKFKVKVMEKKSSSI